MISPITFRGALWLNFSLYFDLFISFHSQFYLIFLILTLYLIYLIYKY